MSDILRPLSGRPDVHEEFIFVNDFNFPFRSVRECNQETKRKCKTVPVQIVVRVPGKTCPQSDQISSDVVSSSGGDVVIISDAGSESVSDVSISDGDSIPQDIGIESNPDDIGQDETEIESSSDDIASSGDLSIDDTETRSDIVNTRSALP